ncbi:MAG TPA: metal-sensitive transcriptional regulator [Jatrophihabitantaceae bacterium]|jgi:DNA-binding FrmR family transcriptional regulator
MRLDETASADVIRRLRRVEGQVGGIVKMIENGRDCAEVVTQLAAASRALDRAGFHLLSSGMRQCLTAAANGEQEPMSAQQLEKLFLSLA